jgi:tetratricopeptide (TPR) repeat protein
MALATRLTFPIAQASQPQKHLSFSSLSSLMFRAEYWIFSTLFALGVIGGLSYLLIFPSDHRLPDKDQLAQNASLQAANDSKNSPQLPDTNSPIDNLLSEIDANNAFANGGLVNEELMDQATIALLENGDNLLTAGNFAAASNRFTKVQSIYGTFTSAISIRLAICAEFRGKYLTAEAHYQRAIKLKAPASHKWLAISGVTRVKILSGNYSEALRLLSDLFLESLGNHEIPKEVEAQISYQLATVAQRLALVDYDFDLSSPQGIGFFTADPELGAMLAVLNEGTPEEAKQSPNTQIGVPEGENSSGAPNESELVDDPKISKQVVEILQRPNDNIDLMVINLNAPINTTLAILTRQIAAAAELDLFASPRAQAVIANRTKSLFAEGVPANLILDHLLLPLNLCWQQDGKRIQIVSQDEKSPSDLKDFWRAVAERTFRRFTVAFPGDSRANSALLSRGNLKYIQDDLDGSFIHYQELLKQNPKDELLARLFFNLGKLHVRFGRNEDAIKQFYHVVDQTYDRQLQSSGYWLVAQLSLETGNLQDSIRAAGRALTTAQNDLQKRLAALTMARSYLISNQPFSANQVLFDNRNAFSDSDLKPTAAVIGSYARYVGVTDESSLKAERERLLEAVMMAKDEQYSNFIDLYVAARAFQALGFQNQAIEKLNLAADSTTIEFWKRRFLFEMAVQLSIAKKNNDATAIFKYLIAGGEDEWITKSLLQLAQIYETEKKASECIEICQRLWSNNLSDEEKQATLNMLGKSYRLLGEHHSAALCFAGMIPVKSAN